MAKAESELRSILDGGFDREKFPWYVQDLEEVPEPAKTLLEKYSKISPGEVMQHVKTVRDRAFSVFPYPCIGSFRFLDMSVPQSPHYPEILERLKSGQKLLDIGCAVGQELRHLVFDGVSSENLYASDLRLDFFEIGYDLFADRDSLKSPFISADIFDDNSDLVKTLTGQVDIINAASFFHLFNWDQQITVAKRVVSLLRAQPGSLLIGRQVGRQDPLNQKADDRHYRHDPSTWKRLWKQVEEETGTKWDVQAWMEVWQGADRATGSYHGGIETFKLRFAIRRL
ncbi:uncharacterized protein PFLUO_LOCUS8026 [Penicillium psychrofluorescens]|uniref:uncharacterized protein n=1 Tax=Penicillium psychrofluorescens TaxID=3158075 RepID=UPI003CCE2541